MANETCWKASEDKYTKKKTPKTQRIIHGTWSHESLEF